MSIVKELNELAVTAGNPSEDLTILAEGNAAAFDPATNKFLVKASGVVMGAAKEEDWVWLDLAPCVEILQKADKKGSTQKLTDSLNDILKIGKTPNGLVRKASIETLVHVVAFHMMDSTWSLHSHPTPVVALAASKDGPKHYAASVFPDETVMCGPTPLFLPFAEPGLELGLGVYQGVRAYQQKHGRNPGQIILGNHGLCTFGNGSDEALGTTKIAVKAARVRLGAVSSGGIKFIPNKMAEKIAFRPDEVKRRADLMQKEMNIKGVTFDIGGVLYSDDVFKRAIKKALIELGAEVTDEKFEKVYDDHLKSGGGSLRSKLCTAFLGSLDRKAELLKVTNDFWIFETADIYSDALPAVKSLKERGLLIGIIANQPATIKNSLIRDGFEKFFDFIGISDVVGLEKPNPEFFSLAVKELNLKPEEVVHIGNRIDNDVKPAKSIGMKTIWVMRGEANPDPSREDLSLPDLAIPNLENLKEPIQRL